MGMETDWPTCCHMSGCAQSLCVSFIDINKYIKERSEENTIQSEGGHVFRVPGLFTCSQCKTHNDLKVGKSPNNVL